jgi:DNA mismatch endonuclease, patch repair protein
MDIVSSQTRSRMMSGIRGKDTRPEILVRRLLHAAGLRFRLHRRDLPGIPDIVLPKYRAAIFVHGCYWHVHKGCHFFKMPGSNVDFWRRKLESNQARDRHNVKLLLKDGWRVLVIWECLLRQPPAVGDIGARIIEWILGAETLRELPPPSSRKHSLGKP